MSDKLQEFHRETVKEILATLTPNQRLRGLSAEELTKALDPATLEAIRRKLNGQPPEAQESDILGFSDEFREYLRQETQRLRQEIINGLSDRERLEGLTADEVMKALPSEALDALARILNTNGPSPKAQ